MKENKDYELILSEDTTENWNVRILTGDFVETVIEYKAIASSVDFLRFLKQTIFP